MAASAMGYPAPAPAREADVDLVDQEGAGTLALLSGGAVPVDGETALGALGPTVTNSHTSGLLFPPAPPLGGQLCSAPDFAVD